MKQSDAVSRAVPTADEVRERSRVLSAKDYPGTIRSYFPYWDAQIRPFLLRVIEAIPADRLDFKPAPVLLTARQIVEHIAEAERVWVHGIIDNEPNKEWLEFVVPHDDPAQGWKSAVEGGDHASLFALLEEWHRPTQRWLDRPIAELDRVVRYQAPGGVPRVNTVQWILSRVLEHEINHRQQLVLYLRLMGLEPPETM